MDDGLEGDGAYSAVDRPDILAFVQFAFHCFGMITKGAVKDFGDSGRLHGEHSLL